MKNILILIVLIVSISIGSEQNMVKITVQSSYDTKSKYLTEQVKCGQYYYASTSAYDSIGNKEMVISNKRDHWIVNIPSKTGRYIEDNAESYKTFAPVISDRTLIDKEDMLEWGSEADYFKINSVKGKFTKASKNILYTLWFDGVPRELLAIKGADTIGHWKYLKYERISICDTSMFRPNDSISFERSAINDVGMIMQDWTQETQNKRFSAYTNVGLLKRLDYMSSVINTNSKLPMIGFLNGMIGGLNKIELDDLMKYVMENPERYSSKLLIEAKSYNIDSVFESKISSPSNFDLMWGRYYATRDINAIVYILKGADELVNNYNNDVTEGHRKIYAKSALWSIRSHRKHLKFFDEDLKKAIEVGFSESSRSVITEKINKN